MSWPARPPRPVGPAMSLSTWTRRSRALRLWVDKRRIERVVTNLVDNAEQYAGGVTRIAVEPGDGPAVRFVVVDRGPGVAPGERDRIFERFYRGQASGQRGVTNGTGLGLSLVAEHVRLHGGRVWAESGDDGENRFVIELPSGDDRALALAPEPGREAETLA